MLRNNECLSFNKCTPRYHITTNGVAPISADKHAHRTYNFSIRSDARQTLETLALKLFTVANLRDELS